MDEDIYLEDALYPWLASDCMADETYSTWDEHEELYYCRGCNVRLDEDELDEPCPECGRDPETGEEWE